MDTELKEKKKEKKVKAHKKKYNHPEIVYNKKKRFRCFVHRPKGAIPRASKDRKLIGAFRLAKSWYFPKFHYCKNKKAKGTGAIRQSVDKAKKLGNRIDREMMWWTKSGKMPRKAHRYSRQLYNIFEKVAWKPVASQQIVGDPEHNVATAFDMLLENKKKELILVDVKTGYETHWTASDDQKLERPFQHVDSSSESHSWLQLALTAILFTANNLKYCETHPLKKIHIVRTSATGAVVYGMPAYLSRLFDDLRKKLLNRT